MKREALAKKILLLGINGLDPRFTLKMVREGQMPNMKRYIERGACRQDLVMLGGHPTVTMPIWASLACGCYPNVHGVTGVDHAGAESLRHSSACHAEPLWHVFAQAGKRTLVWQWPGAVWPPAAQSPNLYRVDGPEGIGLSVGQFDQEMILAADTSIREAAFLPASSSEAPLAFAQSPITPAQGWACAPKNAQEFVLPLSGGRLKRFGLVCLGGAERYERVAIYRSKRDQEPLAILTPGQLVPAIQDEGIKDGERIACIRNMALLELAPDGSRLRLYISAATDCDLSQVIHPAWPGDVLAHEIGAAPPVSLLGPQDDALLNKCILDNWRYRAQWQAQALNTLMDRGHLDVLFSYFHGAEVQLPLLVRYLGDKGHNKRSAATYRAFIEEVYRQIDGYLGQFLPRLDEGWTVVIFSDHALVCSAHDTHTPEPAQSLSLSVMEELGLTVLKRDEHTGSPPEIDWAHTLAIAQRPSHIYVNLKGRQAHGIVDTASQYAVEEEIMTRLYGYRDKKTGRRLISVALRNQEALPWGQGGPAAGDIIYWLAEGYDAERDACLAAALSTDEISDSPLFVGAGPGFKPGCKTDRAIRQIDLAPTIAVLGGVRMPKNCEGAPVYQILTEEF